MAATDRLGTIERRDKAIDVRFERHYPRPAETVWRALTDPTRLADWMGASTMEPRVGGRFELMTDGPHPARGEVLVWDPPSVLELSWANAHAPNSVIRYDLEPASGGTRLVFTHRGIPYGNSALMLPGWHDFFTRLGLMLTGAPPPQSSFRTMQAEYVAAYGLTDVTLDP